uniref:Uncharacterized protein n=1 Tax=viral metagenome TaxID=1070528 RepID=A0A6M3LJ41_9ZZZZ
MKWQSLGINRTNHQVQANDKEEAANKARKLYMKHLMIPITYVQEGWIAESDGEDN